MVQPVALLRSRRSSFRPRGTFSRLLTSLRLAFHSATSFEGVNVFLCTTDCPNQSEPLPPDSDQSLPIDPGVACEHLVDLVRHPQLLLPGNCEWLEQGALEFVGEHPVNAGGVADVWVGKMGDRKVAIKAYRCDSSSNNLPTYARFCKEVLACSHLKDRNIVPFIGVYSTPEHPLALVFEFMDNLNLREYLRNNRSVGRRELLLEIAWGVECMHKLNVAHGNLKITNILVDVHGHARLAGLGAAFPLARMPGVDIDRLFRGIAPELAVPQRYGLTDTGTTKESDVYAFGVLAWEIFTERAPFSDEGGIAGVYSMLRGRRPPRPDHSELSDRVWGMIDGCWESVPSRRKTITEVIAILIAELNN